MNRTANHVVATSSGTVHLAADRNLAPWHVLACNGRAVQGLAWSTADLLTEVTCKACLKGAAQGRIIVNQPEQENTAMPTYNPPHDASVDLWDCPCRECTRLDYSASDEDTRGTLAAFRADRFPEVWDAAPQPPPSTTVVVTMVLNAPPAEAYQILDDWIGQSAPAQVDSFHMRVQDDETERSRP